MIRVQIIYKDGSVAWSAEGKNGALAVTPNREKAKVYPNERPAFEDRKSLIVSFAKSNPKITFDLEK